KNPAADTDDIWTRKHQTASETRRHMEHAYKYGIASGYCSENPAEWVDGLKNLLPKPSAVHTVVHHPSLDFRKLPEFVQELRAWRYGVAWPLTGPHRPIVSYVLEFMLLPGVRVGEVLQAEWDEFYFDPEDMKWVVPGKHTKSGKPRSLPITTTMLAILNEM